MPKNTHRPRHPENAPTLYATASNTTPRSVAASVGAVVYVARSRDGHIKIGHTTDIYNRLKAYGGLKSLIALIPGTYDDEQAIHAQLAEHRARGREYYHATPEVLEVVNNMRATNRQAPITA